MSDPSVGARPGQVTLYLDISALHDMHWTGIAEVTRHLARHLLARHRSRSVFFDRFANVIEPHYVSIAVERAGGGYLWELVDSGVAVAGSLASQLRAGGGPAVGLFPNLKPFHGVFDVELSIFHDLSPILMPELHTPETVESYARGLRRDSETSDLICCVSAATEADARIYLAVPPEKTFVAHLGGPVLAGTALDNSARGFSPSQYAVVIGTLEPRKNLRLVLEFLRGEPEVCADLALFFVGREGWGTRDDALMKAIQAEPLLRERLLFTGFLPEADKMTLLRRARFSIYPSLFEGFGLPVLESMAASCPVIASRTSSITELGVPTTCLFDPLSSADFARAFHYINDLDIVARDALGIALREHAAAFTWERFAEEILSRLQATLPGRGRSRELPC